MAPRKRTPPAVANADMVSVDVISPFLVYHEGEQRGGHLDNVPTGRAKRWAKRGWVTIATTLPDEPEPTE
jgi:hypothetical protein